MKQGNVKKMKNQLPFQCHTSYTLFADLKTYVVTHYIGSTTRPPVELLSQH